MHIVYFNIHTHTHTHTHTQNFLVANIEGAGRHHVRRPPSREKVEQTQARREREMAQYQRGKVPQ